MKILDVPQSGSVAGTTSSRNRFGQYRRTRAVPVNTNTSAQQDARNRLTSFSIAWRSLTDPQRDAWASYSLEHPVTDSLGQSQILTGFQQYVGVNSLLANAAFSPVTDPPTGVPSFEPDFAVANATAAALSILDGNGPAGAGTAVVMEVSPPLSPGRNFNADFRVVGVDTGSLAAAEITAALLTAKFGTLVPGMKFFWRVRAVETTGARGNYQSGTVVLT